MPFVNSPDQFFVSGGDINVLMDMMKNIRQEVLALNKYNPNNAFSIIDTDTLKRFVQLRIIALNYSSQGSFGMLVQNADVRTNQALSIGEAYDIATHSAAAKTEADINFKDIQDQIYFTQRAVESYNKEESLKRDAEVKENQVNNTNAVFAQTADKVYQELKTNRKVDDQDYGMKKNISASTDYGQTDPRALDANKVFEEYNKVNGQYTVPSTTYNYVTGKFPFPKHGEDFDNKGADISEHLTNTIFFSNIQNSENEFETQANYFKGWAIKNSQGQYVPWVKRTFTKKTPYSDVINEEIKSAFSYKQFSPPGSYKFFIEKLHGRNDDGTPHKKNPIISQRAITGKYNLSNRMVFPAYIDNFSDQYTPTFSTYNFIGRGEEVPIYKNTSRELTITFSIIADYSLDLLLAMKQLDDQVGTSITNENQIKELLNTFPDWGLGYLGLPQLYKDGRVGSHIPGMYSDTPESLWYKLNFLAQCTYPYYRQDGKMKEQPIIRARIADFFDVIGYIKNYSLNMNEYENLMDLNPSAIGHIPFAVSVTLNMGILHENEPSSNYAGFYNRKEYDEGTMDPSTGAGLSLNKLSTPAEGLATNSPLSLKNSSFNENDIKGELTKYTREMKSLNKNLKIFKQTIQELGGKLSGKARKQKTEKAMQAYVRINDVAEQLAPQYGVSKEGANFGVTEIDKIAATTKDTTGTFNNAYGGAMSIVQNTNTLANDVNSDLNQLGISILRNDEINNTLKKINSIKPENIIPKTLGDIIDRKKK